ncbi:DNA (cytosine-5-)-methyltransferase [Streptococcus sp. AS20]|uniref:DNA (cytosine-5-)-methyltransferase n=1 Tax=Streptococcus sp. AS20 TaxID=936578 RepID=UPI00044DFE41|nr:DNA (cytosine-5-)-methyltransferase [Streptococcus sp. AS20]EUB22757.1 DNA (cytosine-5-)-methyltransferase [Streptococcus sp. AS20]
MGNSILNKARYSSNNTDEWYTDYKTIENEVKHYESQFNGKKVLCNCDDPYESAFAKYFLKNFNCFKLKKLVCISYAKSAMHSSEDGRGLLLEVDKMPYFTDGDLNNDKIFEALNSNGNIKKLIGDGDFRSQECINYLIDSDIVVTNPPFSKFTELFSLITKYDKQYLLISNQNAITYKEIFPYIKNNKARVGYHFGDMAFRVPDNTEPRKTRFWVDEFGKKWRSLGNAMWLTNLEVSNDSGKKLVLTHSFKEENYPKYDNFDAVHVYRVSEIPMDYYGIMGVPLTYLKYHNDKMFEIVGEANHGSDNEYDLFKPQINGKETFKRILIKRRKRDKRMEFRILDLFCGAGGMSYGMHKNSHFVTKVALDINEKLAQTFKENIPESELIIGNIQDKAIKEKIINLSKKNKVNMIIGGPPCQGFSLKGKKLGLDDPRNFLFIEYLHLVQELKPLVFVIENVKSLMSTSNGWFKNQIISEIKKLGYEVSVGIVRASDYGVPQNRERVIFLCSKNKAISLPEPTVKKPTTVRDAIEDLAYLNSNEGDFEQSYITEAKTEYQKLMRKDSDRLYNHKASNHSEIAIHKLSMIPPEKGKEYLPENLLGKQKFNSTWGRLKWDEPSPTIDTRFDAASNGTNNHPFLNRSITPREAARIQSFDDRFIFYGNKVDIRTQIGNAVPPLMAKAIADHIYENLVNNESEVIENE